MNKNLDFRSFFDFNIRYIPLAPKLNFIKECDSIQSSINKDISYLLKKTKAQILIKKKEDMQKIKNIELEKNILEKMRNLEKKRKFVLKKHELISSSHNNKMILDMILSNKKFLKYLTEKKSKKLKTESHFPSLNDLSISTKYNINSISNTTENSINQDKKKPLLRFKTLQVYNKTINNEYFSTQSSEINSYYNNLNYSINKKNFNDEQNEYKIKNRDDISFPISSTIFPTSISVKSIKHLQSPKKSIFYLRKKKNENNFISIDNENLITDINNSYKNKNNKNKNCKIQNNKTLLIDNKKKNTKYNIKNSNANKYNYQSGQINENKIYRTKLNPLSAVFESNFIQSKQKKRPLTCKK